MKIAKFCLMTSLAFGLPFAATAQQSVAKGSPSDIEYCNALGKAYSSMWSANEAMPVAAATAISRCNTDTQATIAALEGKLRDQKIELPPHRVVAQPPGSTGNTQ
jgi:hypothetical protein